MTEVLALVVVVALTDDEDGFTVVEAAGGPTAAVDDRPVPHAPTTETNASNEAGEAHRFIR